MNRIDEALAQERMRRAHERARRHVVARELAATRRWRPVSTFARAAEARHAARVRRAGAR